LKQSAIKDLSTETPASNKSSAKYYTTFLFCNFTYLICRKPKPVVTKSYLIEEEAEEMEEEAEDGEEKIEVSRLKKRSILWTHYVG
jgi:hypothetical protein